MAGLTECKTCKNLVAVGAETCPHCGQKEPSVTEWDKLWGTLIMFVIVIIGGGLVIKCSVS